ncbi:MAG: LTA synthase family protein [Lachnospiraceae bacterium]
MEQTEVRRKYSKQFLWVVGAVVITLLSGLMVLLSNAAAWVVDTWGLLSMDEIIFHLKVPLEGTSSDVIWDFVERCIPPTVLLLLFIMVVLSAIHSDRKHQSIFLLVISAVSAVFLGISLSQVWQELDIGKYMKEQTQVSPFIDKNYQDPRKVAISFPEQKRNLIYIYLESMESTYVDEIEGGAYEDNYIPELTQLAQENIQFSNGEAMGGGYAATGATWTMGGMFAQNAGLPLKLEIDGNEMSSQDIFMPDIVGLGDILEEQGYKQVLMLGSDAVFGGRKNYFEHHGNYEMWDLYTAKELGKIPPDYVQWWGYEDAKLFPYAQEKLTELAANDEPFNFTMLTADTHFEDGYVCPQCQDKFPGNQYANVMACSSHQVAEFIAWIQQQPFYENTTIVISGDHLTMDSDFCEDIGKDYERTVYNAFINSAVSTEHTKNREFTTMDMFPSTLASMGVDIEGNRLALGTNLFSEEKTLTEEVGIQKENRELNKKSLFYNYLTKDVDPSKVEDGE